MDEDERGGGDGGRGVRAAEPLQKSARRSCWYCSVASAACCECTDGGGAGMDMGMFTVCVVCARWVEDLVLDPMKGILCLLGGSGGVVVCGVWCDSRVAQRGRSKTKACGIYEARVGSAECVEH